jgi:hypothetical protein
MKNRVLIVGAGQLGSRYLQGLSSIADSLEIWVFDISYKSLERAKFRWSEVVASSKTRLYFVSQIHNLPDFFDLVVVSTTADVRSSLAEKISAHARVEYWILEKVLAQSAQDLESIQMSIKRSKQAWVNTPRYQWGLYQKIRDLYDGHEVIEAYIDKFSGIASNSIHFIDLICRWGNKKVENVDTRHLNPLWRMSKRLNFYEIDGRLEVNFSDGSNLIVDTADGNLKKSCQLRVHEDTWSIDEVGGRAISNRGMAIEGSTPLQSELTNLIVHSILSGNSPNLPTLQQSSAQHRLLLSALLSHWNLNMPIKLERLPIT